MTTETDHEEISTELIATPVAAITPNVTPATILSLAISQGADLDRIEKFMGLVTIWEEREAKKAYVVAMAAFKENPPEILKDAHVNYKSKKTGQVTDYKHATLGQVAEKINQALGEHGLSAGWKTEQPDNKIKVTCSITHILGHSESTSLKADPDSSGGKNSIQAVASTISYLQRYTLHAITGTAAKDMDNDGQGPGPEFINTDQATEITDLIKKTGTDQVRFLKFIQAGSVEEIKLVNYKAAISGLKAKGVQSDN